MTTPPEEFTKLTSSPRPDKFPQPRTFPAHWDMEAILSPPPPAPKKRFRPVAGQPQGVIGRGAVADAGAALSYGSGLGVAVKTLPEGWDLSEWA